MSNPAAKVEVVGRTKDLNSLWHKIETKCAKRAERLKAKGGAAVVSCIYQDNNGNRLDNFNNLAELRVIVTQQEGNKEDKDRKCDNKAPTMGANCNVQLYYHVLGLVQHFP